MANSERFDKSESLVDIHNSSTPLDTRNAMPTSIINNEVSAEKVIFKKVVDWSLLNYGFTVPQSAIDIFCANTEGDILRGSSRHIQIIVDNERYPATISNVGFSNDSRQQLQVRYSKNSPIVDKLRNIFKISFEHFNDIRNRSVPYNGEGDKEFIEIVSIETDVYALICYPSGGRKTIPYKYPPFWSNHDSHPIAITWREAGYKADGINMDSQYLEIRMAGEQQQRGQASSSRTA